MSISFVVQRGNTVTAYDQKNSPIWCRPVGFRKNDSLIGYTGESVSIRQSNSIWTYDSKGRPIASRPC
jgi:hypothetical protein